MDGDRSYLLPHGLKDIGEFIQFQKQHQGSELQPFFGTTTMRLRGWEGGAIFNKLSQYIDHDLLFTDEPELLRPRMLEVIVEQLKFVINELDLRLPQETKEGLIRAMLHSVGMQIDLHRDAYLRRRGESP